jgi:hypothetical protein
MIATPTMAKIFLSAAPSALLVRGENCGAAAGSMAVDAIEAVVVIGPP